MNGRFTQHFTNPPYPAHFERGFVAHADLSKVPAEKRDKGAISYYVKKFDVVFICGAEIQAQLRWKEKVSPLIPPIS